MRRRLILAIASVAVVSVVVFAAPLVLVLQRAFRDEDVLRLQRDTVAATRAIDVDPSGRDPIELPAQPAVLTVYDRSGRRIAGRGGPVSADDAVSAAIRTQRLADRVEQGHVVVAVPLVVDERVTGAVRAEAVGPPSRAATWWRLGILASTVVGAAIAAAFLLARRLSRPLERLAASAERLGQGDFATRAPRSGVGEVDEVARALDQTADRLDTLLSRERTFSADASHQLRTPLTALRIELESLQLAGHDGQVEAALAQVERLQETITTLLAVARDTPRDASTELPPLLRALRSHWSSVLADQGRDLIVACATGAMAPMSATVLREILDVLIDNALRHGAGTVSVTVRTVGDGLAVDVADEGLGIHGEPAAVFERRSGYRAGHGIGLALARSLAQAEGAELAVSRATECPVFTLLIPTR